MTQEQEELLLKQVADMSARQSQYDADRQAWEAEKKALVERAETAEKSLTESNDKYAKLETEHNELIQSGKPLPKPEDDDPFVKLFKNIP